eukprot:3291681-Amphidinium_carterae.1
MGTFGIASAAYWFGRVAATTFRLCVQLTPWSLQVYQLLFADDGLLAAGEQFEKKLLFQFLLMELLEMPVSWHKVRGGMQVPWIGYEIDFRAPAVGVSASKVAWIQKWFGERRRDPWVSSSEFQAVLGRLCFVAGVLVHTRPLLGPLYAGCAVVTTMKQIRIPPVLILLLSWFAEKVGTARLREVRLQRVHIKDFCRTDAKAEGDNIVLGGWECLTSQGDPRKARWFSVKLDRTSAPWAYVRGAPYRSISSVVVRHHLVWGCAWQSAVRDYFGSGREDRQQEQRANAYLLDKLLTTKFPSFLVLLEVAEQLEVRDISLNLAWVPREENTEADALTNEDFSSFEEHNRVEVDLGRLPLKVLRDLQHDATSLFEDMRAEKSRRRGAGALGGPVPSRRVRKRSGGLRAVAPWQAPRSLRWGVG